MTFVTNSSSISRGSGTGPGHANWRQDISLSKLACLCSLWEPNPTYGSQFELAVRSLIPGREFTTAKPEWMTPPSIHMLLQPSTGTPLGRGSLRDTPEKFPIFSLGTSQGCISLTWCLIGVFFSLLDLFSLASSNIRHTPIPTLESISVLF